MLLASPKVDLDALFGRPLMAQSFFGLKTEKTWSYAWGDFDLIIGYLSDLARYTAVKRRRGPNSSLSPGELAGALSLNAPASQWQIEEPADAPRKAPTSRHRAPLSSQRRPTTHLSYVEEDPKLKGKILREVHGWMPAGEAYVFFYLPHLAGQPPLLASEWGVQQALG